MNINRSRTKGECYVYVYLDPRKEGDYQYGEFSFDHEPIYVGKGRRKRAYYFEQRNFLLRNKLKIFGRPIIHLLKEKVSDKEAFELEHTVICLIGRKDKNEGPLCNLTDGGDGPTGCQSLKGQKKPPRSEEHRKKLATALIGTHRPDAVRKKISNTYKEKIKNGWVPLFFQKGVRKGRAKGFTQPETMKEKLRNLPPKSQETRLKISLALKGKKKRTYRGKPLHTQHLEISDVPGVVSLQEEQRDRCSNTN